MMPKLGERAALPRAFTYTGKHGRMMISAQPPPSAFTGIPDARRHVMLLINAKL